MIRGRSLTCTATAAGAVILRGFGWQHCNLGPGLLDKLLQVHLPQLLGQLLQLVLHVLQSQHRETLSEHSRIDGSFSTLGAERLAFSLQTWACNDSRSRTDGEMTLEASSEMFLRLIANPICVATPEHNSFE